jgi:hypothetical protein
MARTCNYIIIQDGPSTISHIPFPDGLPDHVDFPPFAAPNADLTQRPVLTFLVSHSGDETRLVISLNTVEVVSTTLATTPTRAWIAVVNHNILQEDTNQLMAWATEGGAGQITVSNLVLSYKNVVS